MPLFRIVLLLCWALIVYITAVILAKHGLASASDVFVNDLVALNWPSQFNLDLLLHMLLVGIWVAWRQKFTLQGIVLGLFCLFGGSLFSYLYVFVLTVIHKGDMTQVVLGKRGEQSA